MSLSAAPIQDGNTSRPHRGEVGTAQAFPKAAILLFAMMSILSGASPGELPVEQSDRWKLTVNQRAAAHTGLVLPNAPTK
jgi:hypothetical protein